MNGFLGERSYRKCVLTAIAGIGINRTRGLSMMNQDESARRILTVLTENPKNLIALRDLARKAGFVGAHSKDFKTGFRLLQQKEVVKLQRSGWASESNSHHRPVVILTSDIYILDETEADLGIESNLDQPQRFPIETPTQPLNRKLNSSQKREITSFFTQFPRKEATNILEKMRRTFPKDEWFKGLWMSLSGMLIAKKDRTHRAFIHQIDANDKKSIQSQKRSFKKETKNEKHAPYDRGFFMGWYLFMDFLQKKRETMKREEELDKH